jgi:hypothetical protein
MRRVQERIAIIRAIVFLAFTPFEPRQPAPAEGEEQKEGDPKRPQCSQKGW